MNAPMSDNMVLFLVIGGIVLLTVIAVIIGTVMDRKRTAAMADLAARTGMFFDAEARELLAQLPRFHLLTLGHSRTAKRWLRGGKGAEEIWLFDYRYVTGAGKNRHVHRRTVAVFPHLEKRLPEFELRPENLFHKIGAAFGYQDIDIDEQPEFSKRYLLRGTEEYGIRQLFTHTRVESLMSMDPICIEVEGTGMLVYPPRGSLSPARIPDFIDCAHAIRQIFTESASSGLKYRLT